ncbi:hypothetical protein, partial [Psychrobacter sp.]|uniref:hypothetical protein n=1 Tax=Psychrobacter sp. TaxID=56811 RepID=UPI0025E00762
MTATYKLMTIFGLGIVNLSTTSCTTNNSVMQTSDNQTFETDIIQKIGYPSYNGYRQQGSVLVGNNYSYLISTGSENLDTVALLPKNNLQIMQPILIYRYPDNSVHIKLSFNYNNRANNLTNEQLKALNKICSNQYDHQNNDSLDANISNIKNKADINNKNFEKCELQIQGGMYASLNNVSTYSNFNSNFKGIA